MAMVSSRTRSAAPRSSWARAVAFEVSPSMPGLFASLSSRSAISSSRLPTRQANSSRLTSVDYFPSPRRILRHGRRCAGLVRCGSWSRSPPDRIALVLKNQVPPSGVYPNGERRSGAPGRSFSYRTLPNRQPCGGSEAEKWPEVCKTPLRVVAATPTCYASDLDLSGHKAGGFLRLGRGHGTVGASLSTRPSRRHDSASWGLPAAGRRRGTG
jgi:hypothetical protein